GDGKRVLFATRRNPVPANSDGGVELFLFDVPTGVLTQVTSAPSTATAEVVSSTNDDGSVAVFSFPRVLSGAVSDSAFANDSEIYTTALAPRASSGTLTILNAASLSNDPSSPKAVAPDSLVTAQGGSLALTAEQPQPLADGSFPLSVGGPTVTVNGRQAQNLYVSPGQGAFLNPKETAIGPATVTITNAEGFPSTGTIMVLSTAPGVFTYNGTGAGEAVILNADTLVAGPFDPTNGHLRLIIFATGVRRGANVTASISGQAVTVESVLRSAELPGLDEVHVFVPANFRGAGIVDAVVQADTQASNAGSLTLTGSSLRDVLINEVLADPPDGIAGDANHDGTRDSGDDEFVELVNTTTRDIDISGYDLLTRGTGNSIVRHTFAAGSILSAGTAAVVFGGGNPNPTDPVFGGALVVKASANTLSLTNTGGVVTLRDLSDVEVSTFTYGGSTGLAGDRNTSLTRSPDVTGPFTLHQTAANSGGRLFSPGTRLEGSSFPPLPGIVQIQVSPPSATIPNGSQQQFSARAFNQGGQEVGDVIFKWRSSDTSVATVNQSGLATGMGAGIAQIFASARGVESGPATLTVTAATPSPSPSPGASPSPSPSASPTPTVSPTPSVPIVISEFRTRGPNGGNDEFIELYNNSDSAIDVSGWKIRGSNNAGAVSTRLTINNGTSIPARRHFLATNSSASGYSGSVFGDQTYTSGITNDGGIAVTLPDDSIVDQVGMSAGS